MSPSIAIKILPSSVPHGVMQANRESRTEALRTLNSLSFEIDRGLKVTTCFSPSLGTLYFGCLKCEMNRNLDEEEQPTLPRLDMTRLLPLFARSMSDSDCAKLQNLAFDMIIGKEFEDQEGFLREIVRFVELKELTFVLRYRFEDSRKEEYVPEGRFIEVACEKYANGIQCIEATESDLLHYSTRSS